MVYKVGRYTTGIALVGIGLMFLLHQFTDGNWLRLVLMLWPAIIIGYGVEYLLATRREERIRFDVGGAVLLIVVYIGIFVYSLFSSILMQINEPKYSVQGDSISYEAKEIDRLRIDSEFGNVIVEATEDDRVTIIPTYHSNRPRDLAELTDQLNFEIREESGTLIIRNEMKSRYFVMNFLNAPVSIDLHIYVPAELATRIQHNFGSVEVRGLERLESVKLDFGQVMLKDVRSNAFVEVNFGNVVTERYAGGIQVEVDFGNVVIDGDVLGPWRIENNFGAVNLIIPRNSSVTYTFDVDLGSKDVPNPPFVQKDYGTINDGLYPLQVEVDFGFVDVQLRN